MVYAVKVTPLDNYNIIVEFNTGEIKFTIVILYLASLFLPS